MTAKAVILNPAVAPVDFLVATMAAATGVEAQQQHPLACADHGDSSDSDKKPYISIITCACYAAEYRFQKASEVTHDRAQNSVAAVCVATACTYVNSSFRGMRTAAGVAGVVCGCSETLQDCLKLVVSALLLTASSRDSHVAAATEEQKRHNRQLARAPLIQTIVQQARPYECRAKIITSTAVFPWASLLYGFSTHGLHDKQPLRLPSQYIPRIYCCAGATLLLRVLPSSVRDLYGPYSACQLHSAYRRNICKCLSGQIFPETPFVQAACLQADRGVFALSITADYDSCVDVSSFVCVFLVSVDGVCVYFSVCVCRSGYTCSSAAGSC
ncbi:unnamed protein product [Rangifer tarandus platyrhynchus]|uniref:Uncharacterized protein n=1 Tax=Rangifer tarandus platyrhynchus TaxID=3082113 RepID=A0ABN8XI98_RANTA|nr:unnamed protein product [Rangifer tarandus platyrhynchus]